MTFISYAQNFEDVMLHRALKTIEKGFYLDVGAQDPVVDSVTKAFYERGWRGINLEPVSHWYERLLADRPEDVNLQVAASDVPGRLSFFEVKDTGLSTLDVATAQRHAGQGYEVQLREVSATPLDAICAERGVEVVHFLKIDVEGAEASVLTGIDLERIRPWIILVEATEPLSTVPTHEHWEHLLLSRGYDFVYFDGLNRFYIASEHPALRDSFAAPPNVFDGFVRFKEWSAKQRVQSIESELNETQDRVRQLEGALSESSANAGRLESELNEAQRYGQRVEAELGEACSYGRRMESERDQARRYAQQLDSELKAARQQAQQLETELAQSQAQVQYWWAEAGELHKQLALIQASRSWRVTAPLRRLITELERAGGSVRRAPRVLVPAAKRLAKKVLVAVIRRALARPALRKLARATLRFFPSLDTRLLPLMGGAVARHAGIRVPSVELGELLAERDLPVSARRIYSELKAAMAARSTAGV